MTITAEQLVNREVHYCVSHLVSTLANGFPSDFEGMRARDFPGLELIEQATELCFGVEDWHEALLENGWRLATDEERAAGFLTWQHEDGDQSDEMAESVCREYDIWPYQREVFEHWIVSDWLADKLEAHGEKVDRDFAGMTIWARTTTGQAIAADSVITAIHAELLSAAGEA